jgi:hypothetical protein
MVGWTRRGRRSRGVSSPPTPWTARESLEVLAGMLLFQLLLVGPLLLASWLLPREPERPVPPGHVRECRHASRARAVCRVVPSSGPGPSARP